MRMAAKRKMHGHRGGPCHTVAIMVVGEVKRITDDFSPPICEVKSCFKVHERRPRFKSRFCLIEANYSLSLGCFGL